MPRLGRRVPGLGAGCPTLVRCTLLSHPAMIDYPVRRLGIDLDTSFPIRWNGGDAFRSALFDALSMSFTVGEQSFIDSLRSALAAMPAGLSNYE